MDPASTCLQPGERIKPNVSIELAKELIQEHYGLQVTSIKELNSYDDNNFYVKTINPEGKEEKYTFKVLNSMDSKKSGHIEVEHIVMKLLSDNGMNCPIPRKNVNGETFSLVTVKNESSKDVDNNESQSKETKHIIRLLSFVEGKIMYDVIPTAKLLEKVGKYLAQVQNILKGKSFQALDNHNSVWMISRVLKLEEFIFIIKDNDERYKLVSNVLSAYRQRIVPILHELEKGVYHGDFNEQNIIVAPSSSDPGEYDIYGVIDFGDIQADAYIFDLAISVCYMMLECVKDGVTLDPFEGALNVLKGYCSVRKVPDKELEILRICIACRLCQSLVMGAYTYSLDPENEYLLTTAKTGWDLLKRVWVEKSDEEMLAWWKTAVV